MPPGVHPIGFEAINSITTLSSNCKPNKYKTLELILGQQTHTCAHNDALTIQLPSSISLTTPKGKQRNFIVMWLEFHQCNHLHMCFASTIIVAVICKCHLQLTNNIKIINLCNIHLNVGFHNEMDGLQKNC